VKRLDANTLRLFLAVHDAGSIARAAERSHIVPSAISRRIGELEAQLNAPLFVRRQGGLLPTPAGEALARHAREAIEALDRIPSDMGAYANDEVGEVRISAMTTATVGFLLDDLERYRRRYPKVRVRLRECRSQAVLDAVSDGSADLGVIGHYPPAERMDAFPYREVPLYLVVHRGHALAARKRAALEQVLSQDLIALGDGTAVRGWLDEASRRTGGKLRLAAEASTYEAMRWMVQAKLGAAVMPGPNVLPYRELLGLAAIRVAHPSATLALKLVVLKKAQRTPTVRRLMDYLLRA
jgi:DNA-binding transcriptional LysR family regulator